MHRIKHEVLQFKMSAALVCSLPASLVTSQLAMRIRKCSLGNRVVNYDVPLHRLAMLHEIMRELMNEGFPLCFRPYIHRLSI